MVKKKKKNLPASAGEKRDSGLIPGSGRSLGGGHGTHSELLPGESQGQRSGVGCSPRVHLESDPTEATWLTHTDMAAIRDALHSVDLCNPTSYDSPPAWRMSFLFLLAAAFVM